MAIIAQIGHLLIVLNAQILQCIGQALHPFPELRIGPFLPLTDHGCFLAKKLNSPFQKTNLRQRNVHGFRPPK